MEKEKLMGVMKFVQEELFKVAKEEVSRNYYGSASRILCACSDLQYIINNFFSEMYPEKIVEFRERYLKEIKFFE